jgi:phosphopantothenate-cysteine ligase
MEQLENQTVRFIDNFSAGTRGASSAEQFLENGYAVIFLHRQFSLLPYSRHYSHSTNCFLDFMDEDPSTSSIVVRDEYQSSMRDVLRKYRYAKQNNLLLVLPFTTVTEYMFELRALAHIMKPLGANALFYLAAAVSDFFIPRDRMAEHKIQSSEIPANLTTTTATTTNASTEDTIQDDDVYTGYNEDAAVEEHRSKKLIIDLDPVPKFLHRLVDGWAPEGSYIVSFKLETDPALLVYKARTSLQRYAHHLVIGNLLSTRKWEVVFVTPEEPQERWIRVPKAKRSKSISGSENQIGLAEKVLHPQQQEQQQEERREDGWAVVPDGGLEIESLIIPELVKLHSKRIESRQ